MHLGYSLDVPTALPSPSPVDASDGSPLRVGDHPALDFLNSVFTSVDAPVDLLRDGQALRDWLKASGVMASGLATEIAAYIPKQLQRTAAEARGLREWFRELLLRWTVMGARGVRAADLEHLNALLAKGRLHQTVSRGPDGLVLQTARQVDSPSAVLAELAAGCADLLATHHVDQVRKCENPACSLWFADTKRGPRRRWCSMAVCGNRMKVAAHRARQRSGVSHEAS